MIGVRVEVSGVESGGKSSLEKTGAKSSSCVLDLRISAYFFCSTNGDFFTFLYLLNQRGQTFLMAFKALQRYQEREISHYQSQDEKKRRKKGLNTLI
jgi:hypothetical protein